MKCRRSGRADRRWKSAIAAAEPSESATDGSDAMASSGASKAWSRPRPRAVGTTEDEEGAGSGGEKDVVALVERGRGLERRRRKRRTWRWPGRAAQRQKKRAESDGSGGDQSFNLGWLGPSSMRTTDLCVPLARL